MSRFFLRSSKTCRWAQKCNRKLEEKKQVKEWKIEILFWFGQRIQGPGGLVLHRCRRRRRRVAVPEEKRHGGQCLPSQQREQGKWCSRFGDGGAWWTLLQCKRQRGGDGRWEEKKKKGKEVVAVWVTMPLLHTAETGFYPIIFPFGFVFLVVDTQALAPSKSSYRTIQLIFECC